MTRWTPRLFVVALLTLPVLALVAQAKPRIKREFVTAYPKAKGTRLDACATCHTGLAQSPPLNPYGAALKKAGMSFPAVEKLDSDGDGVANRKEIDALSFPGDAKDRPGTRRDSAAADSAAIPEAGEGKRDSSVVLPDSVRNR